MSYSKSAPGARGDPPRGLVELAYRQRSPKEHGSSALSHVLGEVAYLVEGVPDRKLKIAFRGALGEVYAHVHQVAARVGQLDGVLDGRRRRQGCRPVERQQHSNEREPAHHARDGTSFREFRRWGSLS